MSAVGRRWASAAAATSIRPRAARARAPPVRVVTGRREVDKPVLGGSWEELGLRRELCEAMTEMDTTIPTEVQATALPKVLSGRDVLIASHTGSGKTLAYLLPLVQRLKEEEEEWTRSHKGDAGAQLRAKVKRPRALILGPTRELVEQVYCVSKRLAHHSKFRSAAVLGGSGFKDQQRALNSSVDILMATPGRLVQHIEEKSVSMRDVRCVILDEADTMFDRGFGKEVKQILRRVRDSREDLDVKEVANKKAKFQGVLVTATLTDAVELLLREYFPEMIKAQTSSLHKSAAGATHHFIPVNREDDRISVLENYIQRDVEKGHRTVVFCNTMDSCRAVEHALSGAGVPTSCYHGGVPAAQRPAELEAFSGWTPDQIYSLSDLKEKKCASVLVCTDLAARGLDYGCNVEHVVMFDFPKTAIDYLHRAGRTARAGRKGRVSSFITRRDTTLANKIEKSILRGEALDGESNGRAPAHSRKIDKLQRVQQNGKRPQGQKESGFRMQSRSKGNYYSSKRRSNRPKR